MTPARWAATWSQADFLLYFFLFCLFFSFFFLLFLFIFYKGDGSKDEGRIIVDVANDAVDDAMWIRTTSLAAARRRRGARQPRDRRTRRVYAKGTYNFSLTGAYIQHIRFSVDELENVNVSYATSSGTTTRSTSSCKVIAATRSSIRTSTSSASACSDAGISFAATSGASSSTAAGGITYADQEFPQSP
jgi:hypothetical protein